MDYFSLGNVQLNDVRVNAALASAPALARNGGAEDFTAMLERFRSSDQIDSSNDGSRRSTAHPDVDTDSKLFQMCLELETFLVKNLLSTMRSTVQKSNFIDQGFAGQIYEDMLYDEYAKDLTRNAGFGLAEQAYLQLTGRR